MKEFESRTKGGKIFKLYDKKKLSRVHADFTTFDSMVSLIVKKVFL